MNWRKFLDAMAADDALPRLEPVRRDPAETLDRVATQLDLLLNQAATLKADMDDTREMLAELRAPKRVEARTDERRNRA